MPILSPQASRNLRRSVLLTLSLLSACAAAEVTNSGQAMTPGAPELAVTGAPGDYLAGRFAASEGDLPKASDLLLHGLHQDPGNPDLLQRAFMATLLAGRPEVVDLARLLQNNPTAQFVLINDDAKAGRWSAAESRLTGMVRQGAVQLLQPLLVAWVQQGAGHTDAAEATLKPYVDGQRFRGIYALHAAAIADIAGRTVDAQRLYTIATTDAGGLNLELARMLASWDIRQGREPEAEKIFTTLQDNSGDLGIAVPALYKAAAQPAVRNATDGMAEAYLALAGALRAQEQNDPALVMLRLALDLRPDLTVARLLSAEIFDANHQTDAAVMVLKPVAATDPLISVVRLRQASLQARLSDTDGALKLLDLVAAANPDRPEAYAMRGDILREQKRYADAVAAYDMAVSKIAKPERGNWPLFYERGISHERAQDWPKAEADFLRALELSPDEPDVLNYLAYSWTEQGKNLSRARKMLERAVEQRPNDGAIIDSLGWVVLRQGDQAGALKLLEHAVELDSTDSTVNGHLGDAYWAAGRKLEAQFQWRRALTLTPEPEDVPKLQAKLLESEAALGNLPAKQTP